MWDSKTDLEIWETIAQEAHSRHSRPSSTYVKSLSLVEASGHRLIASRAAGCRRVLEVGVGGGEHLVYRLPTTGTDEYIGVDLSPDYARICTEKFGIPVECADVAQLPFEADRFDCVIAVAILEHVQSLEQALSEINRVLKPGGKLLVVIPTNGSVAVNTFKTLMTYPTMRRRGIKRPDLVWHHLNVNGFKRVQSLLMQRFNVIEQAAVPVRFMPWWLSPLWAMICHKK